MPLWTEESLNERKANKVVREDVKIRDIAKRDAVNWLIGSPAGRHYLRWLLFEVTGVLSDPFTGESNTTAYACGVRASGDAILRHLLEVNPEALSIILKEEDDDNKSREQRLGNPVGDDAEYDTSADDVRAAEQPADDPRYD